MEEDERSSLSVRFPERPRRRPARALRAVVVDEQPEGAGASIELARQGPLEGRPRPVSVEISKRLRGRLARPVPRQVVGVREVVVKIVPLGLEEGEPVPNVRVPFA